MVDYNRWQATARSAETMQMDPLPDKWRSFGWETREINGHDHQAIYEALSKPWHPERPLAVVANTVKGKGVPFIEDDNNWHYRSPNKDEFESAARMLRK